MSQSIANDSPPGQRRLSPFSLLVLVAGVAALLLYGRLHWRGVEVDKGAYTREFPLFGTFCRLTFWGDAAVVGATAEAVQQELQALHETLNVFDADSELARLNATAAAEPFVCSPRLWQALDAARQAYEDTDGAFDISVGPLMKLWGFHRKRETLPSAAAVSETLVLIGLGKVVFNDQAKSVSFPVAGMALDFGGIAKGYALEAAVAIARGAGIRSGLIDLGGNIYCFPVAPPGRRDYRIGIRNPWDDNGIIDTVPMLDRCIATSGNYENTRVLEGVTVHHIIDPRTGWPVPSVASVTVVSPRGTHSDVFSTAIFVRGQPLAEALCDRYPGTQVMTIRVTDEGKPVTKRWDWGGPGKRATTEVKGG